MMSEHEYMRRWYEKMTSGTPQALSVALPEAMGQGQITQTISKQGVIVSDWRLRTHEDVRVQGATGGDYVFMIFCLGAPVTWDDLEKRQGVTMARGESCIYCCHGGCEAIRYCRDEAYDFRTVKIPGGVFVRLLEEYLGDDTAEQLVRKVADTVAHVPCSLQMERVLADLGGCGDFRGGLGHLYLDGKLLELFAVYFRALLEVDVVAPAVAGLSRTERAAVVEARRIIDAGLAYAPGLDALAAQVHLSPARLSRGFSALYGQPVHQYVIAQRLETGARLLTCDEHNVGEVAALVGYSKASNFAAAFRRRFGVSPKIWRQMHRASEES